MSCVFCAIVDGRAPASVVYDDAEVMAFADAAPVTPAHLLVIPKLHVPYLSWTEEFLAAKVFLVAHRLSGALQRSDLRCDGVNLLVAEREAAGQEVEHLHIHVIPRFPGDGFELRGQDRPTPPRAELDAMAAKVRAILEEPVPDEDA
jgi:diadenosine tetraphosphate (Ap4A) HIT family hydrolase